jgi:hypothetical protein
MDNIICAHKMLYPVTISKIKGVLFEVDFQKKKIDRVYWNFLLETLKSKGFDPIWIKNTLQQKGYLLTFIY